MDQLKSGFFKNFFEKKSEKIVRKEKIEIILEDLSKYLYEFKSDICSGTLTKLIKTVLGRNVKIPADDCYNKMLKIVKQLINNESLWTNKNNDLLKDLSEIEIFLSKFLQNSNKTADTVNAGAGLEHLGVRSSHIFKIYVKFGELKFLIFGEQFGRIDPFSNLKINFKNSLEIWSSLKSISNALKKLNSQKGWIFKNKFVVECHKDLKKLYDDLKQNVRIKDLSPINQSRILYPKLQNCKKYISSAIISRIVSKKIHPDDSDNIKSTLFDLYNSFSDISDALFSSKFEEIDFKNFHLYHNKSNDSSARYYIDVLGKDLAKLFKKTSWLYPNLETELYKKLICDYKNLKIQIAAKKLSIIACIKKFTDNIINNGVIPYIERLKNKINNNISGSSLKIINNLYYDYISIIKRFSITQINYVKKHVHPLVNIKNDEIYRSNQEEDYLEIRKENLFNSFSNLNYHMDEFKELESYLYTSFGHLIKSIFGRVWSGLKRLRSKKKDIYILRKKLSKKENEIKSNFSNLYKNLNKNKKFCGILRDKEKQRKFVNNVYYNHSEYQFIEKVIKSNISYVKKFYESWNNFDISEFNKEYFEDKKVSGISKTFTRISNVVSSLYDDYKNLENCILDIKKSIDVDVEMAGKNCIDSKEIIKLREDLEKLKNEESSCSSKKQKSKISNKIKSLKLELDRKVQIQDEENIQKAINKFNNISVIGTKIIGRVIFVQQAMNFGSNSSLNIVISTDKIDLFKLKIDDILETTYDCEAGYSVEIAKFDVSIGRFAKGNIYIYMSFKNSNAGTMIVDMLSQISSKSKGILKSVWSKIGTSLSKLDNLDYLYKIGIRNKINSGKLDLFPCNIVNEDPIKVDDSEINVGSALSLYRDIKNILKPLQSSKLRQFFKGKTELDKLFYEIKQLPEEIKLASRDPEVCRNLIRKSASDLDTILLSKESSKHYANLSNVKSQLNALETCLVGSTKKISRKKYRHCNICGSCLCYFSINYGMSILITGESSSGAVKSNFIEFPGKIDKLYGMTVVDLEITTDKMDMKFLAFVANFLKRSLCCNFNMKLRAYILTSSKIIKFAKQNMVISSNSKKNIYLR